MRAFLAALSFCLALPVAVEAKPTRDLSGEFRGDRYGGMQAQAGTTAADVTRSARCPPLCKPRKGGAGQSRKQRRHIVPIPAPRPGSVSPLTLAGGAGREVVRAVAILGSRPAGCPHRFCGCALAIKIFGRIVPHLNLAANWLRFPRTAPAPGMVAARRGHVFKLLVHLRGHVWQVWDANSGRGRIRIHPRSIAGYVIVNPRA